MLRFTSTTFHSIINIRNSIFIHTIELKLLHCNCKHFAKLYPSVDITKNNAATYKDEDLNEIRVSYSETNYGDEAIVFRTEEYHKNKY